MAPDPRSSQSVITGLTGLGITWQLTRNASPWSYLRSTESEILEIEPRIHVLTSLSSDSDASLRTTDLEHKIQTT